jgi:hypothetical protein
MRLHGENAVPPAIRAGIARRTEGVGVELDEMTSLRVIADQVFRNLSCGRLQVGLRQFQPLAAQNHGTSEARSMDLAIAEIPCAAPRSRKLGTLG